jgi:hypothetical protein
LGFTAHSVKPAKLTLTPHHLFYLLSRFEELGISVGPMNVRLENLHTEVSPANYVSFLSKPPRSQGRSDRDSIHSVSSVRSVMSSMSSLWSTIGMNSARTAAKTERAKIQMQTDIKYLYSAFTKIPCLRLSPDHKARLISGFEEFPFDTAVPLTAFKNVSALEIFDLDFRQLYGWDTLAEQLRSLTLKRAHVDDPSDLLIGIVQDDAEKRRRRSSKSQIPATPPWPASPSVRHAEFARTYSAPGSPAFDDRLGKSASPRNSLYVRGDVDVAISKSKPRDRSLSPTRPGSSQKSLSHRNRGRVKSKRSGSGSSTSSAQSIGASSRNRSASNLLSVHMLPASKWRFLRHLSLSDNALTSIPEHSLAPLANSLHSLDLSSNLLSEIPDCLATLTALRALNLSNCMIASLHSLARNPLPAINSLNLRSNKLASLAGIERLLSLERLDLRDNKIADPTEMARLTGIPDIREIWVLHNPFVRSHAGYRVTILNLFRGTPGYTDDVIIDATIPGYSERRQLRERVAEAESVPVIKLPAVDPSQRPGTDVRDPGAKAPIPAREAMWEPTRPAPQTGQSETAGSSGTRRRKVTKRRIVDLSIDDGRPINHFQPPVEDPFKRPQVAFSEANLVQLIDPERIPTEDLAGVSGTSDARALNANPLQQPAAGLGPPPQPSFEPPTPPQETVISLVNELHDLNLNGEAYRRKVEALKDEFGTGWLSMLGDDTWSGKGRADGHSSDLEFVPPLSSRPDLSGLRTTSQGIISGSRTLG